MAVFTTVIVDHYIWYSTDTKPAGRPGETGHEINTGMQYVHDGTKWVEDLRQIYACEQALKG